MNGKRRTVKRHSARAQTIALVAEWLKTEAFPNRLLSAGMPDRRFVMEVVYGVARYLRALDWIVEQCANRKPDPTIRPYLLVAAYQLVMMDDVEEFAVINEIVETTKVAGIGHASGFVNAVLRKVSSQRDSLVRDLSRQPLAVRESHPDILIERWAGNFGEDMTADLCKWNNSRAETVIRLTDKAGGSDHYIAELKAEGIDAEQHPARPDLCVILPHGIRVNDLPGYKDGHFAVQDPSTIKAVELLDPQPGERILDACAAPGGKALLIAEKMQGRGRLVALDKHEDRLIRLRQNITRMGFTNIDVGQADLTETEALREFVADGLFDRVLLDVPCSNTGVIRRRPDARWRFSLERLAKLVNLQSALLTAAAGVIRPGGTLVYSTCSLEAEEDEQHVKSWIENHDEFVKEDSVMLFPSTDKTDGAYAAKLQKENRTTENR